MISDGQGGVDTVRLGISRRLVLQQYVHALARRDGDKCHYCQASLVFTGMGVYGDAVSLEHLVPKVYAGATHPGNLVLACRACNNSRSMEFPDNALEIECHVASEPWAEAWERLGVTLTDTHRERRTELCWRCGTVRKSVVAGTPTPTLCGLCDSARRYIKESARRQRQSKKVHRWHPPLNIHPNDPAYQSFSQKRTR